MLSHLNEGVGGDDRNFCRLVSFVLLSREAGGGVVEWSGHLHCEKCFKTDSGATEEVSEEVGNPPSCHLSCNVQNDVGLSSLLEFNIY